MSFSNGLGELGLGELGLGEMGLGEMGGHLPREHGWNKGGVVLLSRKPAISWKRSKIEPMFRGLRNIFMLYYFVSCRLSTHSKIHDLEWPFYVKFSLLRTALSKIILHTYRRAY